MTEIFKSSISELYKKPFRVLIVFLLNLFIIFGINKTETAPEIFSFFMPLTFIVIFTDKKDIKWSSVFISLLTYFVIFFLSNCFLYKYVGNLEQKEFVSNGDMIFYKSVFLILEILNCIFVMGIFYSVMKKTESKIPVIQMFKYFSEKSSKIILVFYGIVLSMFSTVLILYGIDNSLCYNFINMIFFLCVVISVSFLLLIFKNFLLSEKADEVIFRLKEKKSEFYKKFIIISAGIIVLSIGITVALFLLFTKNQNIFLLTAGGTAFLISVVIIEIGFLNIFIPCDKRKTEKVFTVKKLINTAGISLIGIFVIGAVLFIFYIVNMNFFIYNTLIFYTIPVIILNYLGIILNFQIIGIFLEKPFFKAFKDGICLSLKFMNLKVIPILIGVNIVFVMNVLNGIFQIVIWGLNILIFIYMLEFYLTEKGEL